MSIEELLAPLPRSVLIEAAYFAIQLIKHRVGLLFVESEPAFIGLPPRVSKESEQIAKHIIDVIVQDEGKPFSQLSKAEAEKYTATLADIVHRRSVEDLRYDKSRGQKILDELRQPGK